NLTGTLLLLRAAVTHGVARFVFGSSMSVHGSSHSARALSERDLTAPDEPYGAAKRAVELVGESLASATGFGFAALRIARVLGPGARSTASGWRSQIFENSVSTGGRSIGSPFAPSAPLWLTHVVAVARRLRLLAAAADLPRRIYTSPADIWQTQ